jgi:hypothetical protein
MNNYGVLIVDVFDARIVFRRFDVRDGEEYHAECPWMIPWPFEPASAPYRRDVRKDMNQVPSFAADAVLRVAVSRTDDGGVVLTMPVASGEPRPFMYRVRMDRKEPDGRWVIHSRRDFFGDAWQRAKDRPEKYDLEFAGAYFVAGGRYRFRIAPVNCWGKEGKSATVEFTAPERTAAPNIVWECSDAMKECKFLSGLAGKESKPRKGDFYEMDNRDARLVLPDGVWKGPKGARFRFVADIHTVQEGNPTWTIVLRNPKPLKNAHGRISTPDGDSGRLRYVVDFKKISEAFSYYLLVREGGVGKIRFGHVRIERL